MFVSDPLMDWHSQVFTIFEMLLEVQQCLSGMKQTFVINGKQIIKNSWYAITNNGNDGIHAILEQTCPV